MYIAYKITFTVFSVSPFAFEKPWTCYGSENRGYNYINSREIPVFCQFSFKSVSRWSHDIFSSELVLR